MKDIERRWLNVKETASYLGTTVKGIYGLVARALLPHTRIGSRLKFDRKQLDRMLEGNSVKIGEKDKIHNSKE